MIIKNLWIASVILMNVLLLFVLFYFARRTKERASKIGFGIMIFVYVADIVTLAGGVIA